MKEFNFECCGNCKYGTRDGENLAQWAVKCNIDNRAEPETFCCLMYQDENGIPISKQMEEYLRRAQSICEK